MNAFGAPDPHKVHMVVGEVVSQGSNGTVNVMLADDGILEQVACVGSAQVGDQAIVLIADLEAWAITGPPAPGAGGGGGGGGVVLKLLAGLGITIGGSEQYPEISINKAITDMWYGGPRVEAVDPGLGIIVGGSAARPAVAVDRTQTDQWYPNKIETETAINALDQRVDALIGQLVYAGTYNAETGVIETLSSLVKDVFPDAAPNGYADAVGKSLTTLPAMPWNAKHFFIVSREGPHSPTDGIDYPTGNPTSIYAVGDWILSNGRGVFGRFDPVSRLLVSHDVEPMMAREANSWLHMSYSARLVLASSIVVDTVTAGLPVNEDTVQKALGWLLRNKVNRSGDTMTGYLTLPAAMPVLPDHATRKGYVDDNIHEHLRYRKSYQITGADLNWVLTGGFYDGAAMGNAPNGDWWHIEVQVHSNGDGWVRQIARYFHDPELVYSRLRQGGTWTGWTRGYSRYADSSGTAWDSSHLQGHVPGHFAAAGHSHDGLAARRGTVWTPGGNGAVTQAPFHYANWGYEPIIQLTANTSVPGSTVKGWSMDTENSHWYVRFYVQRSNTTHTWAHIAIY